LKSGNVFKHIDKEALKRHDGKVGKIYVTAELQCMKKYG